MKTSLFHLAFPVHDLQAAQQFYVDGLGCKMGRSSDHSLILNLGGHQIVAQLTLAKDIIKQKGIYPRHFGLVFKSKKDWETLWQRVVQHKLKVYQEPKKRFTGEAVEHDTFFLEDPSGNLLEFKYYVNASAIFEEHRFKQVGEN